VSLDALVPLDDLAGRMTGRGVPDRLLTLGKFGAAHQLYVPWMQASYIMVANNAALPYLPDGADLDALGYDQLAAWASAPVKGRLADVEQLHHYGVIDEPV
jgi:multiple sugar transport system substrate-binding protein